MSSPTLCTSHSMKLFSAKLCSSQLNVSTDMQTGDAELSNDSKVNEQTLVLSLFSFHYTGNYKHIYVHTCNVYMQLMDSPVLFVVRREEG